MDNDGAVDHVPQTEPLGLEYQKGGSTTGQENRQVTGMVRVICIGGVVVSAGIGKGRYTCAFASGVNVKAIKAIRQAADFRRNYNEAPTLIKTHLSAKLWESVTAVHTGNRLGPPGQRPAYAWKKRTVDHK